MTPYREEAPLAPVAPRALEPWAEEVASSSGKMMRIFGAVWGGIGVGLIVVFMVVGALSSHPELRRMASLPLTAALAGAVVFALGRRARQRVRSLMQTGVEARGEVTAVAVDMTRRVNGIHPYRIDYVFTDQSGARVRGAIRWWPSGRPLECGDGVVVIFDANDSAKNTLWMPVRRS